MTFIPAWVAPAPLCPPAARTRLNRSPPTPSPIFPSPRSRFTPRACDPISTDPVSTDPISTDISTPSFVSNSSTSDRNPSTSSNSAGRPAKRRSKISHDDAPSPLLPQPIPGPKGLPVVGNALDILDLPLSELMLTYARTHGPFLKFSILSDTLYLVSDPVALQHMNTSNSRNYLDRWTPPGFGPLLYDGRLRGLVFSQGRYWMHHRQVVGSVFRSRRFLNNFAQVVTERTNFLLDTIWSSQRPTAHAPITVNVHQAMRMLALDVIGLAAFGTDFGAQEAGSHPIETALSAILHDVLDVIKSPFPLWRVMRTPGRDRVSRDLRTLQTIEMDLIEKRRASLMADPDAPAYDFLAMLLRARDSDRDVDFNDDDLMWDVHDVIFAGHETTSSALAAALWLIAGSPRVEAKIREELATVLADGRLPSMDDMNQLTYLDMVFNEAMRLYPPTALVGRIAKEADVICGYNIPAKSNVLVSPYVMGRLESLWDNPEEFRPERFAPENSRNRHPLTHSPFGMGPRICLGARMATLEAKMVLATLLQRVTFQRTSDELVVDYDSTVSFKSGMDMVVQVVQ